MIQRIQTVYWLISAILLGICIFIPLFEYIEGDRTMVIRSSDVRFIYGPLAAQIILTIIVVLLYKFRKVQVIIGYLVILNLLAILFGVFVEYKLVIEDHSELIIKPWIFIFLFPVIFQILAIKAVNKDEELVKSMDRLR